MAKCRHGRRTSKYHHMRSLKGSAWEEVFVQPRLAHTPQAHAASEWKINYAFWMAHARLA
jgi:hypothetical protein